MPLDALSQSVFRYGLDEYLAVLANGNQVNFRSALCSWEDELFTEFRRGHSLMEYESAKALIRRVFRTFNKPEPSLLIVPGFDDPRVGGYANLEYNYILIETGFLYRFLVLHECAHILAPADRNHGPAFIAVLEFLYRQHVAISREAILRHLRRHGLPETTLPEELIPSIT